MSGKVGIEESKNDQKGKIQIKMSVDYFNTSKSFWEPMIEKVGIYINTRQDPLKNL